MVGFTGIQAVCLSVEKLVNKSHALAYDTMHNIMNLGKKLLHFKELDVSNDSRYSVLKNSYYLCNVCWVVGLVA